MKACIDRILDIRWRNHLRLLLGRHPIEKRQLYPDLGVVGLKAHEVVFDVGANIGRFMECVLAYQPRAQVHAFEPLPMAFDELARKFGSYPGVHLNPWALGNEEGQKCFNVSRYDQASSFLEQDETLSRGLGGRRFDVVERIPVTVRRLAGYAAAEQIGRIKLLKMDVQGYEIEVLKGAESVLDQVEWIYTEAQFETLYQGQPLFYDIHKFLCRRGFALVRMCEFRTDDEGKLMEADLVFRRQTSGPCAQTITAGQAYQQPVSTC